LPKPTKHPCGRHPGDAALDRESLFLEDAREIFRGLVFLITEFTEADTVSVIT